MLQATIGLKIPCSIEREFCYILSKTNLYS